MSKIFYFYANLKSFFYAIVVFYLLGENLWKKHAVEATTYDGFIVKYTSYSKIKTNL